MWYYQEDESINEATDMLIESIPSDGLKWAGASDDQLFFMKKVYDKCLGRVSGTFVQDVEASKLKQIEGGYEALIQVADDCKKLLAAARAAIATEKVNVEIGITSAYRSASRQFALWQSYFPGYYKESQKSRSAEVGGEHGDKAAESLSRRVCRSIAIPGYSNHNKGEAIDFSNKENCIVIHNTTSPAKLKGQNSEIEKWEKSWFWNWLNVNAATYNFYPYKVEPWHWEHKASKSQSAVGTAGAGEVMESVCGCGGVEEYTEDMDWGEAATLPQLEDDRVPPYKTIYAAIDLRIKEDKKNKTGIYIPDGYNARDKIDMLVYLHGVKTDADKSIDFYWNKASNPHFAIREMVNDSGKNIILVAPNLGPKSQKQTGILATKQGFDFFIESIILVLHECGPFMGMARPLVNRIFLAAHSGGGFPLREIARLKGGGGYADSVEECWCFDGLYFDDDENLWAEWAKNNSSTKLFVYYKGTTKSRSLLLKKNTTGLGNVVVEEAVITTKFKTDEHNQVPASHMPLLLENAPSLPVVTYGFFDPKDLDFKLEATLAETGGGSFKKLTSRDVHYLALEGGGGKGFAYIGAIKALEELGILKYKNGWIDKEGQIKGISGSSAGAITAVLLSIGYTSAEIKKLMSRENFFNRFYDLPEGTPNYPSIYECKERRSIMVEFITSLVSALPGAGLIADRLKSIVTQKLSSGKAKPESGPVEKLSDHKLLYGENMVFDYGLFSGCFAWKFFEGLLQGKTGISNITFRQLFYLSNIKLVITGTNLEKGTVEYFSNETTPNFPVATAVRISMSLPIGFKPVRITKSEAERLKHPHLEGLWIDGGVKDNIPIRVFEKEQENKPNTLGLRLELDKVKKINGLFDYVSALMDTFINSEAAVSSTSGFSEQTITLDTTGLSTANFNPPPDVSSNLINKAYEKVNNYFVKNNLLQSTPMGKWESKASSTDFDMIAEAPIAIPIAKQTKVINIRLSNKKFNNDRVVGCTISIKGQSISGITNSNSTALVDITSLPNGSYTIEVKPVHVHSSATYWDLGNPSTSPPDRIWLEKNFAINIFNNVITTIDPDVVITGMNMQINILPAWMMSPNKQRRRGGVSPDLVVIHHTGSGRSPSTITGSLNEWLGGTTATHYVIDRDGSIIKLVHESESASHAGCSYWGGRDGVNNFSIGIELVHSNNGPGGEMNTYVENFTPEQYNSLSGLLDDITAMYNISVHRIVGHNDIGTSRNSSTNNCIPVTNANCRLGRKSSDPGQLFNWQVLESQGFGLIPMGGMLNIGYDHTTGKMMVYDYGAVFSYFPDISLRLNDSDTTKRYGGVIRAGVGNAILDLQTDLKKVGYFVTVNGLYDTRTAWAVHMFNEHFFSANRFIRTKALDRFDADSANMLKGVINYIDSI